MLDADVRRASNGTALLGGSPFRVMRLSPSGSRLLDRWLAGDGLDVSGNARALRDRLIGAGMLHPLPGPVGSDADRPTDPAAAATPARAAVAAERAHEGRGATSTGACVGFVVPVLDDAGGLARLLRSLRRDHPTEPVVVVDDGSADPAAIAAVGAQHRAVVLRHAVNRGPAAARNTGWKSLCTDGTGLPADPGDGVAAGHGVGSGDGVGSGAGAADGTPDIVVFLDADVVPVAGAIRRLLSHFGDERVAAVAPRVQAEPGIGRIARYESANSPLDMGNRPALVHPGSRVSYVPSAALAVRASALSSAGGFDEAMRYGEDVDLVWRLIDSGSMVRYEPLAVAHHRTRSSLRAFARQRFGYGTSAADLAHRHGDRVAPLQLPAPVVVATVAGLLGGRRLRLAALGTALAGAVSLRSKLDERVDHPTTESLHLTARMHRYAIGGLTTAATRSWAPLLLLTTRLRRYLGIAVVVPALAQWMGDRPAADPLSHVALRAVDHGAYCCGVWAGALGRRSPTALLPRIRVNYDQPTSP